MLQSLRDKTSGLIAKIVLGALIFVFSFFGIESYFMGRNDTWVAKVDKTEISSEQFRERFQVYRQNMLQRSGGQLDPALLERYAAARAPDRAATTHASDALVRWFSSDRELLRIARGATMAALDRMPAAKRELAFAMMGYRE